MNVMLGSRKITKIKIIAIRHQHMFRMDFY